MEVKELAELMQQEFRKLDKRLDGMDRKITMHDRMLFFLKGIGAVIVVALSYMGIKIHTHLGG